MEPKSNEQIQHESKMKYAPNADESCKHCGLWGTKLIEGYNELFMCAIDREYRYCEGRCTKWKKLSWFDRLTR
jgi:hypothetical protein